MKDQLNNPPENYSSEKKLANALYTIWKTNYSKLDEVERRTELAQMLTERAGRVFEKAKTEGQLMDIIEQEKKAIFGSTDEWARNMANKLSEVLIKYYSLEDIEKKFHDNHLESGVISLNKIFTYSIEKKEDEDEILRLHMPIVFIKDPIELRKDIRDGMVKLQESLVTDPRLRKVKNIVMRSHLIFKNPGIVERWGFEVKPVSDRKEVSTAVISAEKFLSIKDF